MEVESELKIYNIDHEKQNLGTKTNDGKYKQKITTKTKGLCKLYCVRSTRLFSSIILHNLSVHIV